MSDYRITRVRRSAIPDLIRANEQLTAERDEAVAAVQRVRELHAPDARVPEICSECSDEVTVGWPCDSIRALDGSL